MDELKETVSRADDQEPAAEPGGPDAGERDLNLAPCALVGLAIGDEGG